MSPSGPRQHGCTSRRRRLRAALAAAEATRASLQLNPSEELALEALAFRLGDELRPGRARG